MEQRTREWYVARLGKFTGSEVGKLMTAGRSKGDTFGETAKDYIYDKAAERLLRDEVTTDGAMWDEYYHLTSIGSKAMDFGTEQEPYARRRYGKLTGRSVHEIGFVTHKDLTNFGTSADGIVQENGIITRTVEIKCPLGKTFAKYAAGVTDAETLKKINPLYYWQCVSHCVVLGSSVTDFVVYNPFMQPDARLKVVEIVPLEGDIDTLLQRVCLAEAMCNEVVQRIKG